MKIFKLPLFLYILATAFFSINVDAQPRSGMPPTAKAKKFSPNYCVVNCDNLWERSLVILYDVTFTAIGMSITNDTGFAAISYNCVKTPYSITSCLSGFGCLNALVIPETMLPVKLKQFSALVSRNNSVQLNWVTELETSSLKYIVQKSNDAKNFVDIGEIPAGGNSDKLLTYHFTDINYNGGLSYFRLKQVDMNGSFEYSRILYVNEKKPATLVKTIGPNPFTSEVQLFGIPSTEVLQKNINVHNTFGQPVSFSVKGTNSIVIDPSAPTGIYFIRVNEQTFRLFKKQH